MVDGVLGDRQIPHVVEAGHALPLQRGDRNKGECSTWNIRLLIYRQEYHLFVGTNTYVTFT